MYATDEGIHNRCDFRMPMSDLDKADGTDEIYARAIFLDADGANRGDQHSNVVTGDF